MNILTEITKTFASSLSSNVVGSINYYNLNSSNTVTSPNVSGQQGLGNTSKSLSFFLGRLIELESYEINELTYTIVGLYKDYLNNFLVKNSDLISTNEVGKEAEVKKINKVLTQIGLRSEIIDNLNDIIYYGSHSFKLNWSPKDRTWSKKKLFHNNKVVEYYVEVEGKEAEESNLILTESNSINEYSKSQVIRIGALDLNLVNDLGKKNVFSTEDKTDIYLDDYAMGASPLYYNITEKVKEYLLKEALISILSIKDLIQPLLLLLRFDKNTAQEDAVELARKTENLINNYVDISTIMSSTFSVSELVDTIINNIRVVPDYNDALGSLNTLDLSRLSEKIREIRGEQDNLKEEILSASAVPLDLYRGNASKWEAIKSSQRLNSRINYYINLIENSIKRESIKVSELLGIKGIKEDDLKVNLFNRSAIDFNNAIANTEIIKNLLDSLSDLIKSSEALVESSKLIDKKVYLDKVKLLIKDIHPDFEEVISDKTIEEFINSLVGESDSEETSGKGYFSTKK